jgi:hypothetical protein
VLLQIKPHFLYPYLTVCYGQIVMLRHHEAAFWFLVWL